MQIYLQSNLMENDFAFVRQGVMSIQGGDFIDEFNSI